MSESTPRETEEAATGTTVRDKPRSDQLRPLQPASSEFFGKGGERMCLGEWVLNRQDPAYWQVARDMGDGREVETAWTGHDPAGNVPPLIFETTVHRPGQRLLTELTATGHEAYNAHDALVACLLDRRPLPNVMSPRSPATAEVPPSAMATTPALVAKRARMRAARRHARWFTAAREWAIRTVYLLAGLGLFIKLCEVVASHLADRTPSRPMKPYVIDPARLAPRPPAPLDPAILGGTAGPRAAQAATKPTPTPRRQAP